MNMKEQIRLMQLLDRDPYRDGGRLEWFKRMRKQKNRRPRANGENSRRGNVQAPDRAAG